MHKKCIFILKVHKTLIIHQPLPKYWKKNPSGLNAASLATAQSYIDAFAELAKKNNTVILPANIGDVNGTVSSAVAIYQNLARSLHENENKGKTLTEERYNSQQPWCSVLV